MQYLTPPKYVKQVLTALETHEYKAFLVGGCVRDMLMQRRPDDWDICTDAFPDEIRAVFPKTYPTGLKHGTVTVAVGKHRVEVTTFRQDGTYTDRRRPDSVSFVSDLTSDLRRRDFTINAIALPLNGVLADPFGGLEDLGRRLIRCVGEPEERFGEDALRMFRALRFSSKLGFDIEQETMRAVYKCSPLASALAPERICAELQKILVSKRPWLISRAMSFGLLDGFLLRPRAAISLRGLSRLPVSRQLRWAALGAALQKNRLITSAESLLRALRLDGATIRAASRGVSIAMRGMPGSRVEWKRLLASEGQDAVQCAAAAADMLEPSGNMKELSAIRLSGECFTMKRLAVDGNDLLRLGMSGVELGRILRNLLEHVIEHPDDNDRERLLGLAMSLSLSGRGQCADNQK